MTMNIVDNAARLAMVAHNGTNRDGTEMLYENVARTAQLETLVVKTEASEGEQQ